MGFRGEQDPGDGLDGVWLGAKMRCDPQCADGALYDEGLKGGSDTEDHVVSVGSTQTCGNGSSDRSYTDNGDDTHVHIS
jgi:hypothetical protein